MSLPAVHLSVATVISFAGGADGGGDGGDKTEEEGEDRYSCACNEFGCVVYVGCFRLMFWFCVFCFHFLFLFAVFSVDDTMKDIFGGSDSNDDPGSQAIDEE